MEGLKNLASFNRVSLQYLHRYYPELGTPNLEKRDFKALIQKFSPQGVHAIDIVSGYPDLGKVTPDENNPYISLIYLRFEPPAKIRDFLKEMSSSSSIKVQDLRVQDEEIAVFGRWSFNLSRGDLVWGDRPSWSCPVWSSTDQSAFFSHLDALVTSKTVAKDLKKETVAQLELAPLPSQVDDKNFPYSRTHLNDLYELGNDRMTARIEGSDVRIRFYHPIPSEAFKKFLGVSQVKVIEHHVYDAPGSFKELAPKDGKGFQKGHFKLVLSVDREKNDKVNFLNLHLN